MLSGGWEVYSSVQFSHSVVSDSLQPHELQHARPPCPSLTPGVHSDSPIESVMPSSHLIHCRPLLLYTNVQMSKWGGFFQLNWKPVFEELWNDLVILELPNHQGASSQSLKDDSPLHLSPLWRVGVVIEGLGLVFRLMREFFEFWWEAFLPLSCCPRPLVIRCSQPLLLSGAQEISCGHPRI